MPYYLAELYMPSTGSGSTAEAAARARAAAEELAGGGQLPRLLRIIFVPGDETCFVAYEAPTAEVVAEAGRRAGLDFERIVPAVENSAEPQEEEEERDDEQEARADDGGQGASRGRDR